MEMDRGRLMEIGVSVGVVGLFAIAIIAVGWVFDSGGLAPDGGVALVGAIAAFVLAMAAVGIVLAYHLNQE